MKTIKLSVTDLERLWILTLIEAEDNSKKGSKKQKIYYELSNKLKRASSNQEDKDKFQDDYDFDRGYLPQ
jgi:hypothetical protein